MSSTKQSKTVHNPSKPFNTQPQSTPKNSIASIWNLIENKFASLEERIDVVEKKITEQYEEVIGLIRNIDETAKSALDLAMSNSALIVENTEKTWVWVPDTIRKIRKSIDRKQRNQGGALVFEK